VVIKGFKMNTEQQKTFGCDKKFFYGGGESKLPGIMRNKGVGNNLILCIICQIGFINDVVLWEVYIYMIDCGY